MKDKTFFVEKARIILAKEYDVPPDDIDINAIIDCCERAAKESNDDQVKIVINGIEEANAVCCKIGEDIVKRVFDRKFPFFDLVEKFAK